MATFPNGQIPADAMTALSVGGFLLPAAAQNFESWRVIARNAGWNLTITSAADAFRTYVIQERIFRQRYTLTPLWQRPTKRWNGQTWYLLPGQATAAVPGTSNHGKGLAVDVKDAGGFKGKFYEWMAATGPALGWSNTEGRSINEPWHWVNDNVARGAIGSIADKIPESKEEDDMPLNAATDYPAFAEMLHRALTFDVRPKGFGATGANGQTILESLESLKAQSSAIRTQTDKMPGVVIDARDGVLEARKIAQPNIDEAALAAALAPLINAATLTDTDLSRIATYVADEQARRLKD